MKRLNTKFFSLVFFSPCYLMFSFTSPRNVWLLLDLHGGCVLSTNISTFIYPKKSVREGRKEGTSTQWQQNKRRRRRQKNSLSSWEKMTVWEMLLYFFLLSSSLFFLLLFFSCWFSIYERNQEKEEGRKHKNNVKKCTLILLPHRNTPCNHIMVPFRVSFSPFPIFSFRFFLSSAMI